MDIKKVMTAVPEISIKTPVPTGTVPEGRVLTAGASPLHKTEKELVVGVIVTAASRKGQWATLDTQEFFTLLKCGPGRFMQQGVVEALFDMAAEGYIELVTVNGKDHVVPQQKLADILPDCRLAYF